MRPFLAFAALLLAAAALPARAEPRAEEVGAAFGHLVSLPGEVSLAAALLDGGEPRYFLTQKAERPLRPGTLSPPLKLDASASPSDLVRALQSLQQSKGGLAALAADPGPYRDVAAAYRYFGHARGGAPGALSASFLLRSRGGRWIAFSAVWNGAPEAVSESAFVARVKPLLRLFAEN